MEFNGISVEHIYRAPLEQLPIPEDYRVSGFRPPKPKDLVFSVLSHSVVKATADFHELCPRLILVELEPCELCGCKEPVVMAEAKKTERSRPTLMMLCEKCIASRNAKVID